jgi:hypothetical protein
MARRGQVFYDRAGKPVCILGVGMEVTMHQRAEGEVEQWRHEAEVLAQLAQSLNASLDLMRQRAGAHHVT